MSRGVPPVYFTDENTLGLGKLMRRGGRLNVVYPGHESLPEIPLGSARVPPSWSHTSSMGSVRCGSELL